MLREVRRPRLVVSRAPHPPLDRRRRNRSRQRLPTLPLLPRTHPRQRLGHRDGPRPPLLAHTTRQRRPPPHTTTRLQPTNHAIRRRRRLNPPPGSTQQPPSPNLIDPPPHRLPPPHRHCPYPAFSTRQATRAPSVRHPLSGVTSAPDTRPLRTPYIASDAATRRHASARARPSGRPALTRVRCRASTGLEPATLRTRRASRDERRREYQINGVSGVFG